MVDWTVVRGEEWQSRGSNDNRGACTTSVKGPDAGRCIS